MAGPASTIFRNPRASQKSKEKDALFVDQLPIHDHRWRFVTREIVFLESQSHNETLNFCYTNTITYTAWGGPIVTVCLWSTNKLQSGSIVVLHDSFILVGGKQFCVRNTQVQLGFDSNLEVHEPTEKKPAQLNNNKKNANSTLCPSTNNDDKINDRLFFCTTCAIKRQNGNTTPPPSALLENCLFGLDLSANTHTRTNAHSFAA